MSKKEPRKKVQTSSILRTMPMTSPKEGGRCLPKGFIPYDGTQEEENKALKLAFWLDGSNPYKNDTYSINRFISSNHHGSTMEWTSTPSNQGP